MLLELLARNNIPEEKVFIGLKKFVCVRQVKGISDM
jgi:hypothetical protein